MRDEQSDSCQCIRCRGGKPILHVVSNADVPIVCRAAVTGLRNIYEPHDVPQEIVDAIELADIRLAAVKGEA